MYTADSPSSLTAQIGAAVEHRPGDAWTRRSGNDCLTSPPCRGKAHRRSEAGAFIVVFFFFPPLFFSRLRKIPTASAARCELLIPMETKETGTKYSQQKEI